MTNDINKTNWWIESINIRRIWNNHSWVIFWFLDTSMELESHAYKNTPGNSSKYNSLLWLNENLRKWLRMFWLMPQDYKEFSIFILNKIIERQKQTGIRYPESLIKILFENMGLVKEYSAIPKVISDTSDWINNIIIWIWI